MITGDIKHSENTDIHGKMEKLSKSYIPKGIKPMVLQKNFTYLKKKITVVHLHNGTLHSRKKEGTPTFPNSMDGTREHHAE